MKPEHINIWKKKQQEENKMIADWNKSRALETELHKDDNHLKLSS